MVGTEARLLWIAAREAEGARQDDLGHPHRGSRLTLYLDGSAVVKLLIDEPDSNAARAAVADADVVATSALAYAEARSALARGRAIGRLDATAHSRARRALDERWRELAQIDLAGAIVWRAGDVAERHLLRALDAVHVASARDLADSSGLPVTFASWDRRQRAGAAEEQLSLFPVTL